MVYRRQYSPLPKKTSTKQNWTKKNKKILWEKKRKDVSVSDVIDNDDDEKSNNKIMQSMLTVINNSVFYIWKVVKRVNLKSLSQENKLF